MTTRTVRLTRLTWASVVLALTLGTAVPSARAQQDPGEIAERVRAQRGYGDDLPIRGSGGDISNFPFNDGPSKNAGMDARRFDGSGQGGATERQTAEGGLGQAPPPDFSFGGGLFAGEVVSTVLMVGVGILMVVLIIVLFYALRGDKRPPPPVTRPKRVATRQEGIPDLPWDVGDPDELAAQGKYSEAILAVLVTSLKVVGWRPRGERARTAREVYWSMKQSDGRRTPLGEVIRRAERVRFAGDEATAATFDEVRHWGKAVRSGESTHEGERGSA